MTDTTSNQPEMYPCPHCSNGGVQVYHGGACPKIKAVEYYPNGAIKRVEMRP